MPQYKRPPITEAVVEIRLEDQLSQDEVDQLRSRFEADYPFSKPVAELRVEVKPSEREAKFDERSSGYRLASGDQADILVVTSGRMACSRLPPYTGWNMFRGRAEENWRTWKRVVGYRKIQRVGVRYINRIDIPVAAGEKPRIEDYLRVYPETGAMTVLTSYVMQLVGPLGEDDCRLVLNSKSVPSPLVDHVSLVFDIDIVREGDVPQKDDEVWSLIDRIRTHKNRIFEASVTDKARELFNA